VENSEGRTHLEKPCVDVRKTENKFYINRRGTSGQDCSDSGQGDWRATVITKMKFRVPYNAGISWLAKELFFSQEGLCSTQIVSQTVSQSSHLVSR
jgi:hypothetical protein